MNEPCFPPLFSSMAAPVGHDPFRTACAQAAQGCDAGLVVHALAPDRLRAAMVFAPEVPLQQAVTMLPLCGIGFQNALGALAPPEVAVHLEWAGGLRVNGGICGRLHMAASTSEPAAEPDWLVVGIDVPLWPDQGETGETPDHTALYAEGCSDIDPVTLLEAWVRHTLVWINRWMDDGTAPLHKEWRGLAHGLNEDTADGHVLGVDEHFGLLLRQTDTTTLRPLTQILETYP